MEKKKFVLRIDDSTMQDLEKWAADEFRSLNSQIEYLLTEAVKKAGRKSHKNLPAQDKKE